MNVLVSSNCISFYNTPFTFFRTIRTSAILYHAAGISLENALSPGYFSPADVLFSYMDNCKSWPCVYSFSIWSEFEMPHKLIVFGKSPWIKKIYLIDKEIHVHEILLRIERKDKTDV